MSGAVPAGWEGILEPGEQILWRGRPSAEISFAGMEPRKTVFGIFFFGFALFWTFMAITMPVKAPLLFRILFPLFGLPFLYQGAKLVGLDRVWQAYERRSSWYTLTDRRAFIASAPLGRKKLGSWPITARSVLELVEGRPASLFFAREGDRRIGFERIEDGREVLDLMRQIQNGNTRRRGET